MVRIEQTPSRLPFVRRGGVENIKDLYGMALQLLEEQLESGVYYQAWEKYLRISPCTLIVEFWKEILRSKLPDFELNHLSFPFFQRDSNTWIKRARLSIRADDMLHNGQDTLRIALPRESIFIVADVAAPLFGGNISDYPVIVGDMGFIRGVLQERYVELLRDDSLVLGPAFVH